MGSGTTRGYVPEEQSALEGGRPGAPAAAAHLAGTVATYHKVPSSGTLNTGPTQAPVQSGTANPSTHPPASADGGAGAAEALNPAGTTPAGSGHASAWAVTGQGEKGPTPFRSSGLKKQQAAPEGKRIDDLDSKVDALASETKSALADVDRKFDSISSQIGNLCDGLMRAGVFNKGKPEVYDIDKEGMEVDA